MVVVICRKGRKIGSLQPRQWQISQVTLKTSVGIGCGNREAGSQS